MLSNAGNTNQSLKQQELQQKSTHSSKKTSTHPHKKLTVIGDGIAAAFEIYHALLAAEAEGIQLRATVFGKGTSSQATIVNVVPSGTPDEMLSVVPRGAELMKNLGIKFNRPSGILVTDVPGVNESKEAKRFIQEAQKYSEDDKGHHDRTQTLLELGKMSMKLWQDMYESGDAELKQIMEESNYNPCRETSSKEPILHDGYRIDLIYNIPNAAAKAEQMKKDYNNLGYTKCRILSPIEVSRLDPFLTDFCHSQSMMGSSGGLVWKNDTVALYRPGGCIETSIFLPKFYDYLRRRMGQYVNEEGQRKDCFRLKYERHVDGVVYDNDNKTLINGLRFFNNSKVKYNKHSYDKSDYAFCPGAEVGTLERFGFKEPAYAGFGGVSLMLNIPIPPDKLEEYSTFNHCMEVHQEGVVLAWQARKKGNKIFIGVAGTKAFYGKEVPDINGEFAIDRAVVQANMIKKVLPRLMSMALGRNLKDEEVLTQEDVTMLEKKGIAKRWVGRRAVTYDGFPTLGSLFNQHGKVINARTTDHLSSAGTHATGAVVMSRKAEQEKPDDVLSQAVLSYGCSRRSRL